MTTATIAKSIAKEVISTAAVAVLSKFRRKLLERREGSRVFISNGRENARIAIEEAALHVQRNAEQERIAREALETKAEQERLAQEELQKEALRKAQQENTDSE